MRHKRLTSVAIGLLLALGLVTETTAVASATASAPSIEVVSSANPSVFGQTVVLTATVTDPARPPAQITGTMVFSDEETLLGTAPVRRGKAKLSDKALDVGNDPITATFTPTGGGSEIVSAPFPQVVNAADTTIALSSSKPTANYGDRGNVTAKVASVTPASVKPTGSVDFLIDGSWFWTAPLDTLGRATLPLSFVYPSLTPGTYSITASYGGDANYNPSTTATALAQTLVGATSSPVSTITLNAKGQPVFSPSSFRLNSADPAGCNVTITNNTATGFALLYGTPGAWKMLPGGTVPAGASRGVGVGLSHFTGYFTVREAANHITIKCV